MISDDNSIRVSKFVSSRKLSFFSSRSFYEQDKTYETSSKRIGIILFVGKSPVSICNRLGFPGLGLTSVSKTIKWLMSRLANYCELPHAIICDINLPENTLKELVEFLGSNYLTKDIPVIFYTQSKTELELEKAIKLSGDDLFCESDDVSDILFRIESLVKIKKIEPKDNSYINDFFIFRSTSFSIKRIIDVIVSTTALLALSPVMLIIAIAIRLESKGSILYVAPRAGFGYKVFSLYKFRTMVIDADKKLNDLSNRYNQYSESDSAFIKLKGDPRITKVGSLLRNTSFDEIPQLINVLKGDMSLVGNRPLPLYEAQRLTKDEYAERFLAPAGITGLWQIKKRGKADMSARERILLDRFYAKNHSVKMDFWIMSKTIPAMIQRENI